MNQEISKGIQQLVYNPAEVLVFNGEDYENIVTQGTLEDGKYIVAHCERKNYDNENYDIAIVSSMRERTYPGALLLADQALVNSLPTSMYAKKGPALLRIDLPGMGSEGTASVVCADYSSVSEAINDSLDRWFKENKGYSEPANFSYNEARVYNEDHLQAVAGFNLGEMMNLDFTNVSECKEQMFVLTFKQIFYNVSIDGHNEPGDFFAEGEKWEELKQNNPTMGNSAPPAFVSSVAYGRTIYVALKTANMSDEVEANLKLVVKDGKFDASILQKSIFASSEYSVIVLGGNVEKEIDTVTKDFGEIEKIITENAVFSKNNMGAPISYTTAFLKDKAVAVINSSASYVETSYTSYNSGSLRLEHDGAYVAKFYVNWKEISYDDKGNKKLESRSWGQNGDNLTAGFSTVIPLPANATDIHVKAQEKTGLVWEPWRTVIDQDIPLLPEISVEIWGTTLKPKGRVNPEV